MVLNFTNTIILRYSIDESSMYAICTSFMYAICTKYTYKNILREPLYIHCQIGFRLDQYIVHNHNYLITVLMTC